MALVLYRPVRTPVLADCGLVECGSCFALIQNTATAWHDDFHNRVGS
jgi:hypothetical protein